MPTRLLSSPLARAAAPWFRLALLNLLFVAPSKLPLVKKHPLSLFTPSGDLLLLTMAVVASYRWKHGHWVRRGALALGIIEWAYLWNELVVRSIVQKSQPLYDQLFLIRHLGVLVLDLWGWSVAAALLGGAFGLVLLAALIRLLMRATLNGLLVLSTRAKLAGLLAIATATTFATAVDAHKNTPRTESLIHWTAPALANNLRDSWRMYRSLQRGLDDSPYAHYESTYKLTRKPDIHLMLVESYGRMLISDPDAGPVWREQVERIEARLADKGWSAVSAFSRAPTSGGRSWLAEATLITGVFVRFEAVFQHLLADVSRTPNLVSYLDSQGYTTVLLAPKNRPRPGVEAVNRYNYDRQILADDLQYTGPSHGWGEVPDQYSLGFARENVFNTLEGPLFTNFHMVSSHAPWEPPPEVVDNWRDLNDDGSVPESGEKSARRTTGRGEFMARVRRYQRTKPRYTYMGNVDALKIDAYAAAIAYDLEVVARYLEKLDGDAIVVLMGDHQPPLLSREDASFDVPMHILARDTALLDEFRDQGFIEGLALNPGRNALLAHEGLFSMMMRALVRCCGESSSMPPYLPDGALGLTSSTTR